jgi:hypothetical protein
MAVVAAYIALAIRSSLLVRLASFRHNRFFHEMDRHSGYKAVPVDVKDYPIPANRHQDEFTSEHANELASAQDPPGGYVELCELCGSFNIETLVSDYWEPGKLFDLDALIDSASRCRMCDRIFGLQRLRDLASAHQIKTARVRFAKGRFMGYQIYGCLAVYPDYPSGFWDGVDTRERADFLSSHLLFTNAGDIASTKYGIHARRTLGNNTSSAETFETARKMLRNCLHGHPGIRSRQLPQVHFRTIFGQPKFGPGCGPARLIDVFANNCDIGSMKTSKIVDAADIPHPYLALSYRWNLQPPQDSDSHLPQGYVTKHANILARRLDIVEEELPKTFRDAIYATRSLGVRYLWIDAVCIIQDSTEDWLEQSGKMGSIFGKALLTLVAAAGEHSEAGMFNERSTYGGYRNARSDHDERLNALHTILPGGSVRSTLYIVSQAEGGRLCHGSSRMAPLSSRAWCLQEDLLSPRKLYYASDQLYWQCGHLVMSEDHLAEEISVSPENGLYITPASGPSYPWYDVVISRHYASRTATMVTDRLIAVAGLARHAAATIKSRYLAGLWEVTISRGLLWRPLKSHKHKEYCAPSWSWASQDGGVVWDPWSRLVEIVPGCEYLRADINPLLGSDEFGGVSSAALTLRSKVIELTVEARPVDGGGQLKFHASHQGVKGWALLDEAMNLSNTRLFAVPITYVDSLMVAEDSESNIRRRVGMWVVPTHNRITDTYLDGRRRLPMEPWECPANYVRWSKHVLPTIPFIENTIV